MPVHLQPAYADLGYRAGDFPISERTAAEVLSLPMFPELTVEQVATVAAAVRDAHVGAAAREIDRDTHRSGGARQREVVPDPPAERRSGAAAREA